jgi:hypothetical protein
MTMVQILCAALGGLILGAGTGFRLMVTDRGLKGLLFSYVGMGAPNVVDSPLEIDGDGIPVALEHWIQAAMAPLWGGSTPLSWKPDFARQQLAQWWGVHDAHGAMHQIGQLFSSEPTAWNRARVFIVALSALQSGYLPPQQAWAYCYQAMHHLRSLYSSFHALTQAYLAGRRAWARLPADGSGDGRDPAMIDQLERAHEASRENWYGVNYDEDI